MGPCVARLESLGEILQLVVGAFGEVSSDLDRVVTGLAESRVLFLSRESGKPVTEIAVENGLHPSKMPFLSYQINFEFAHDMCHILLGLVVVISCLHLQCSNLKNYAIF